MHKDGERKQGDQGRGCVWSWVTGDGGLDWGWEWGGTGVGGATAGEEPEAFIIYPPSHSPTPISRGRHLHREAHLQG